MIIHGNQKRHLEQIEYTWCPHCRKRGAMNAMTYMPEMSFRGNSVWICPKCGITLDKVNRRIPKPLRPTNKGRVFQVLI